LSLEKHLKKLREKNIFKLNLILTLKHYKTIEYIKIYTKLINNINIVLNIFRYNFVYYNPPIQFKCNCLVKKTNVVALRL